MSVQGSPGRERETGGSSCGILTDNVQRSGIMGVHANKQCVLLCPLRVSGNMLLACLLAVSRSLCFWILCVYCP